MLAEVAVLPVELTVFGLRSRHDNRCREGAGHRQRRGHRAADDLRVVRAMQRSEDHGPAERRRRGMGDRPFPTAGSILNSSDEGEQHLGRTLHPRTHRYRYRAPHGDRRGRHPHRVHAAPGRLLGPRHGERSPGTAHGSQGRPAAPGELLHPDESHLVRAGWPSSAPGNTVGPPACSWGPHGEAIPARGEQLRADRAAHCSLGTSPRARGAVGGTCSAEMDLWCIPACAGRAVGCRRDQSRFRNTPALAGKRSLASEASPRRRGGGVDGPGPDSCSRNTPASAGKRSHSPR